MELKTSVFYEEQKHEQTREKQDIKKEVLLQSTKQVVKVREENARLRRSLEKIVKDYQSLEKCYLDIVQQPKAKRSLQSYLHRHGAEEEPELVSLSLGTSTNIAHKKEKQNVGEMNDDKIKERLALRLDCNLGGSIATPSEHKNINVRNQVSLHESKEEDGKGSTWPAPKRARVSVRAKCSTATMNDGCHWRKYGQKVAKGNPCPRAYYRCTGAPDCPVRKKVQRCAEDMSILVTTYEGTHSHPLTPYAAAMASAIAAAAAACMFTSDSSTSTPSFTMPGRGTTSPFANPMPASMPHSRVTNYVAPPTSSQNPMTDMMAKAITAEPNFRAALATAVASYVSEQSARSGAGDQCPGHGLQWGEHLALASANLASQHYKNYST